MRQRIWNTAISLTILMFFSPDMVAMADEAAVVRGAETFKSVCSRCHMSSYEESRIGAPGLKGVLDRHDAKWINQWLQGPEAFAKTDETAAALIKGNKYHLAMPTLPEMQDAGKRADIIEFLKTLKGDE